MKLYTQFHQTRTKKNLPNETLCEAHLMLKGFRACTVLLMGNFPHYRNTEYYLHMNIPAVNTRMLMIMETYDSERFKANIFIQK